MNKSQKNHQVTDPSTHHIYNKVTKELIICINSVTIEIQMVHSLQEPDYSKLLNKSSVATTCHLTSTPLKTFLGKWPKIQPEKKPYKPPEHLNHQTPPLMK